MSKELKEAAQQALEALIQADQRDGMYSYELEIAALRTVLAQQDAQAVPPSDTDLRRLWAEHAAKMHGWASNVVPAMHDLGNGPRFECGWHEQEFAVFKAGYLAALTQQDAQAVPVGAIERVRKALAGRKFRETTDLEDLLRMAANVIAEDGSVIGHMKAKISAPTPPAQSDNERLLRLLLAVRVAGVHLYADDGEMCDCSEQPHIDFKRDSVKEIERKLIERGMKKAWGSIAEFVAPTPPAQEKQS